MAAEPHLRDHHHRARQEQCERCRGSYSRTLMGLLLFGQRCLVS